MMKNPVLFNSGSYELKDESQVILHELAVILRGLNNAIIVEGHTDDVPILGSNMSNWELSDHRAEAVIRYFVNEERLSPERFAAAGYGEFQPLASNDTEENKSKNRRIEIVIVRGTT
jgi:chemotaxis protein MotB